ncbi:MAG: hypothetical protein BRD51_06430 [Bacteroidetes bacterium SW_11_64_17]|nr:MAG: hypothetical protein BRD51_06430 [Bacteroidetes bacterium SW_11_64_17]
MFFLCINLFDFVNNSLHPVRPLRCRSVLLLLALSLTAAACSADEAPNDSAPAAGDDTADPVTLFAYFEGNGETGVFLKSSDDGLNFREINDGAPVFTPPTSWPEDQQLTRDPSIIYQDGTFHMVWTTNWEGQVFGYARSPDLKSWTDTTLVRPFPKDLPAAEQPNNVWAPELHHDPVNDDFFVVFSSTIPAKHGPDDAGADTHGNNHRMYVVRTGDFETFSDAERFYDPGFSSIDGQLVYDTTADEDRWVMAFKHERLPEHGGKTLRLVTRDPETGEFSDYGEPIVGPGSGLNGDWAEGPTLLRTADGTWRLYWDAYREGYYGVVRSQDLKRWTDATDTLDTGVDDPRHGDFLQAPSFAVGWSGAQ